MTPGAGYWAARALGSLGDRRAVEPLIERLQQHPASVDERTALVDALGKLGDVRAIEVLEPLVASDRQDNNSWKKTVGECALRAIKCISHHQNQQ